MKNVTVTLPEEVAHWAKVWAAKHNTSMSRMLGNLLLEKMNDELRYQRAMNSFLSREPIRLKEEGQYYPSREGIHDR
jgi:hypothetical protein